MLVYLLFSDWSFANGMGEMPDSTCKFVEGESSGSLCGCSSEFAIDARNYVVCEVRLSSPFMLST